MLSCPPVKACVVNKSTFLVLPLFLTLLWSCSGVGTKEGEKVGTATGAVLGTIVGSKMGGGKGKAAGAGLGGIFGAWLGKTLGRTLEEGDLRQADATGTETMESAEAGETAKLSNPDTGTSGTYTPTSGRVDGDGRECRDFESTILIDGRQERAVGRACRGEDGTWVIVE